MLKRLNFDCENFKGDHNKVTKLTIYIYIYIVLFGDPHLYDE